MDPGSGRPAWRSQWSIGVQQEINPNLIVEAEYVGNVGVWWQAPGLLNLNAISPGTLQAHNIDLSTTASQNLLTSTWSSAGAQAAGIVAPYAGFPTNATVAQALRPYPQFGTITAIGDPRGKTWYDSLQAKVTRRLSHNFLANVAFTWQKSLAEGVDSNTTLNNILATQNNTRSINACDQPLALIVSAQYTMPKLIPNRYASYMFQGWQIGILLNYSRLLRSFHDAGGEFRRVGESAGGPVWRRGGILRSLPVPAPSAGEYQPGAYLEDQREDEPQPAP
jgi:hypothetical protein